MKNARCSEQFKGDLNRKQLVEMGKIITDQIVLVDNKSNSVAQAVFISFEIKEIS